MWNKNERDGKLDEVKGKVKETIGRATDDPVLESEGIDDQVSGKVQKTVGKAQRKVGEAIEDFAKSVKR